jgi:hypothetical protein
MPMISRLSAIAVALAILGGCGGSDHASTSPASANKTQDPLAVQLSAWSSSATSYNAILHGCNQPYPTTGYVAACTRTWRLRYEGATSRLRRVLRAEHPSSPTCGRALAQARSLTADTTNALRQAFESYSALLDNRPYRGSRVSGQLVALLTQRADRISKRNTNLANHLGTTIGQACST